MSWSFSNDKPIFQQLEERIVLEIISGRYEPGSKLEPVRELAMTAGVNPNTMQRALADGADLVRRQQSVRRVSEKAYEHPEAEVWGTLYLLEGDCASPIQFMLTDRRRRFFRGALYFDFEPKADSIAPVVGYLRQDVVRLMETFYWK